MSLSNNNLTGQVFTLEEIKCLEEDSIFHPQEPSDPTGTRKVSAGTLNQLSLSRISSLFPSGSVSVQTHNFDTNLTYTCDIPISEEGVVVLVYIGFTEATATAIYERYANRPDPGQNSGSLVDHVAEHISILKTREYEDMDAREAITRIGLNQQIQDALTDPYFADIFGTASLHYWVKDTLQANYAALLSRQKLLKDHARRRLAQR